MNVYLYFLRKYVIRCLIAVTSKFLNVNQYLFDNYQELVWFVLILLSSMYNTRWFLAKTMGVSTNCPDIKDRLVSFSWVEYGGTTHMWLTIGGRLNPWTGQAREFVNSLIKQFASETFRYADYYYYFLWNSVFLAKFMEVFE